MKLGNQRRSDSRLALAPIDRWIHDETGWWFGHYEGGVTKPVCSICGSELVHNEPVGGYWVCRNPQHKSDMAYGATVIKFVTIKEPTRVVVKRDPA